MFPGWAVCLPGAGPEHSGLASEDSLCLSCGLNPRLWRVRGHFVSPLSGLHPPYGQADPQAGAWLSHAAETRRAVVMVRSWSGSHVGQEGEGGAISFPLPKVRVENGGVLGQEKHLFLFIPLCTPSPSMSLLLETVPS